MWEWISDNWSIITTIIGALVAALKWFGKEKYGRLIEKIVEAVEEEKDNVMLKKTIKLKTKGDEELHRIVKKVTAMKAAVDRNRP